MTVLELPELKYAYNIGNYGNIGRVYNNNIIILLYGDVSIYDGNQDSIIEEIHMENLKEIGSRQSILPVYSYPSFFANDKLQNLKIMDVRNVEYVHIHPIESNYMKSLQKIILGPLRYLYSTYWGSGYLPCVQGNVKLDLVHIEVGIGTSVNINLRYWNPSNALDYSQTGLIEYPSICKNNLEQFLYNFRTHIINKLYNYTGKTKHTITLRSNVYNIILGTDSSEYANTFYMPGESIDYVASLNQKLSSINWGLAY